MSRMIEFVTYYAEKQGWCVFPLCPFSKFPYPGQHAKHGAHVCSAPLHQHGVSDATRDMHIIEAWWREHPDANIGVATGKVSGIVVLDIDIKHEKRGDLTLEMLEAQRGPLPDPVLEQRTWSGGLQKFYDYGSPIRNSAGVLGEGLDIRGDGGYVVVPPSVVRKDGKTGTYSWLL